MNELSMQIQKLLTKENQFLHDIYVSALKDYSYLWDRIPDMNRLRQTLILIIRLFISIIISRNDTNLFIF